MLGTRQTHIYPQHPQGPRSLVGVRVRGEMFREVFLEEEDIYLAEAKCCCQSVHPPSLLLEAGGL